MAPNYPNVGKKHIIKAKHILVEWLKKTKTNRKSCKHPGKIITFLQKLWKPENTGITS